MVAFGLLRGQSVQPELLGGSFIFIVVFLACDSVSSSSTNLGRWLNGLLIGGLAWVFAPSGGIPTGPEALVPAILLASVFAPLIDTLVVMLNTYARRRPDA
jgi:Na+-transporting NADH:ubiquinone oxidoreductase subunit B